MTAQMAILFLLSSLACVTTMVAGVQFYLRTRNDALNSRLEELLVQGATATGTEPRLSGDFWDFLLQSTYGLVFGKSWFREKETELMRAGIRGPGAVKVYGVF